MKRKIVIGILIIIVIGGIIAYRMYDERTPDVVNRKPDIMTNAASLIAAFNSDTASASKEYLDKVIEVTGVVKSIAHGWNVLCNKDRFIGFNIISRNALNSSTFVV